MTFDNPEINILGGRGSVLTIVGQRLPLPGGATEGATGPHFLGGADLQ